MARKKPEALREMKNEELEQQLAVLTEERFRREIARIKTILAERKRA